MRKAPYRNQIRARVGKGPGFRACQHSDGIDIHGIIDPHNIASRKSKFVNQVLLHVIRLANDQVGSPVYMFINEHSEATESSMSGSKICSFARKQAGAPWKQGAGSN